MKTGLVLIAVATLACAAPSADRRPERAASDPETQAGPGSTEREESVTASVNREGDATFAPGEASAGNVDEGTEVRAAFGAAAPEIDADEDAPSSNSVNREGDATFSP